jgi:hypothetical protein
VGIGPPCFATSPTAPLASFQDGDHEYGVLAAGEGALVASPALLRRALLLASSPHEQPASENRPTGSPFFQSEALCCLTIWG